MITTGTVYAATFCGAPEAVARVRAGLRSYLAGCPVTDDVVLIVSELATNAVRHSASKGRSFTVRCETLPGSVLVEVTDSGGPWLARQQDGRPHGLDIVSALARWGTRTAPEGGRVVWARVNLHGC